VFRLEGPDRAWVLRRNWHPGCPVGLADLRLVRVSYWDFDGTVRQGPLVLHEDVAGDVLRVFQRLFRARFPIHRIALAPRPRPIDWDSTRNLTSSFNCREATGNPGSLSQHSYGWEWGGHWVTLKDYMHFSLTGR
jgi:hypothetical protein